MTDKDLLKLGVPRGKALGLALKVCHTRRKSGVAPKLILRQLKGVVARPEAYLLDEDYGSLAKILAEQGVASTVVRGEAGSATFRQWGSDLDPASVQQMEMACRLPISVRGALMPDAHVGYGLPIGGVLATRGAVIPYAVGVDIACRVKMSVLDLPLSSLDEDEDRLRQAIAEETRFGIGASFKRHRQHEVMDRDWTVSPITRQLRDKAWSQLGTSGSGNHFVEFGVLEIGAPIRDLEAGRYVALLSHSGSRGTGAQVCAHYSKLAMSGLRGVLDSKYQQLSWLSLDSHEGQEYWAAMELMGHYASANHACIHDHIARNLGVAVLGALENHHNFAWKERHDGEDLVVHRKGATPAGDGVLGIIPGTMATPAYVVRGLGKAAALNSAAHGAGRVMSRTQAKKTCSWERARSQLHDAGVTLISAGLDEVPMVYKDIDAVMAAQADLVTPIARFFPRLVKMAPAGERAED
ncbi:MAG: RtcB family protein [Candidatus Hydrogenedentes bacterium]|nr:RtcB family protein [Candidatus Hydrogenedentota bacterium]